MNTSALQRVQAILDETGEPTDYVALCGLLTDIAHYAASKHWDLAEEAGIAAAIVARREAA